MWKTTADLSPDPRLVVSLWGNTKDGKTSLALTFPQPIYVMNFDFGLEELIRTRARGVTVYWEDFFLEEEFDPSTYRQVLDRFRERYIQALAEADQVGGTVVVDTASQLWQLIQSCKLEEVRQRRGKKNRVDPEDVTVYPFDYADANNMMAALIQRAVRTRRANAVFVNKAKERYNQQGQPTGVLEPQWFKDMPGLTQMTLYVFTRPGAKGREVVARVDYNRFWLDSQGVEIVDPSYDTLTALMGS